MRTPIDDRLLEEVRRFKLRFTCEHCAHFAPSGACAEGYPADEHRDASLHGRDSLVFCKSFEAR